MYTMVVIVGGQTESDSSLQTTYRGQLPIVPIKGMNLQFGKGGVELTVDEVTLVSETDGSFYFEVDAQFSERDFNTLAVLEEALKKRGWVDVDYYGDNK